MAEIETKKLVIISEFLTPIIFPKNPDKIEPNNGRKTIKYPNVAETYVYMAFAKNPFKYTVAR